METKYKDPDDRLDYKLDWADWLGDDNISEVEFIAESGITVEQEMCYFFPKYSTVWLSGGTVGETYEVTTRILTEQLRIKDKTFKIRCKEQ